MYDLAIFDLDGTLIDSVGDIADALNAALAARGLPTHADDAVRGFVGGGVRKLVTLALGPELAVDEARVAEMIRGYRDEYRARPVGRTRLYAGVRETLRAIAGCVPMAIATNKPGGLTRTILAHLELTQLFALVLGEDDVGVPKPDPRIVDEIRARLGVPRERVLYVGDSAIDAATAERAGVDFCLLSYGYATEEARNAAKARYRVGRFTDVAPLLGVVVPSEVGGQRQ